MRDYLLTLVCSPKRGLNLQAHTQTERPSSDTMLETDALY